MALSKENSKEINEWLFGIDADLDLVKYSPDFLRLDFKNTKTLKFFKPKDFEKFACTPSALHRRILLHNIEKLKSGSPSLFVYDTPEEKDKQVQHVQGTSVCLSVCLCLSVRPSVPKYKQLLRFLYLQCICMTSTTVGAQHLLSIIQSHLS